MSHVEHSLKKQADIITVHRHSMRIAKFVWSKHPLPQRTTKSAVQCPSYDQQEQSGADIWCLQSKQQNKERRTH